METLENLFTPEVLWFIAGVILLIMELSAPGLFILFFGVGAIIVGIVCLFFDPSFTMQLLIFLFSSVALLFLLRKWLKKIFIGRTKTSGEIDDITDSYLGEKALVTNTITPEIPGNIELHGTQWKAEADSTIKNGTPVKVIGKNNLVLTVEPINK